MAASIAHLPEKPSERDHNKQQVAVTVKSSASCTGFCEPLITLKRPASPVCWPEPNLCVIDARDLRTVQNIESREVRINSRIDRPVATFVASCHRIVPMKQK
jgi:hypothetical protein